MQKKAVILNIFLLMSFLLSGCYSLSLQSARDTPVQFNRERILKGHKFQVIRHFYREVQMNYIFGISDKDTGLLNQILKEEVAPEHMVINLFIRRTYNALDVAVSLFTLGIYSRAWVIIEGDIIEF